MIDIIIPVYNAYEDLRDCLESVWAYTKRDKARVVIVDDASTDPRIEALLDAVQTPTCKDDRPDITVLQQTVNRGFVAAANLGMRQSQNDVVLLNSDTLVTPGWLASIEKTALSDPRTATVTPFTNNGEICSYPSFCRETQVQGLQLEPLVDAMMAVGGKEDPDLPTAVGFCMYIKRDALKAVGFFDETSYERGYGEENDFCERATAQGWKHKLCTSAFVVHKGGRSFKTDTAALKSRHWSVLIEKFPGYPEKIKNFIAQDPLAAYRQRVIDHLAARQLDPLGQQYRGSVLMVSHAYGGGVEKHVEDLVALMRKDIRVEILRPLGLNALALEDACGNQVVMPKTYWPQVIETLKSRQYDRIHVHHVHGHSSEVLSLHRVLQRPVDVTLHDFGTFCPQYNLTTPAGTYCGEPAPNNCQTCLNERPHAWGWSIAEWRVRFGAWLQEADRVFVPSSSAALRIQKHWPSLAVQILPHPPRHEWMSPVRVYDTVSPVAANTSLDTGREILKIGVMGGVSNSKGLNTLRACAALAAVRKLPMCFVVMGYTGEHLPQWPDLPVIVTGEYFDQALPWLLSAHAPHILWFPSAIPETYSYTLDAALSAGIPVLSTAESGAIAERLQQAGEPHWVPAKSLSASEWLDAFMSLTPMHGLNTQAHSSDALADKRQKYHDTLLNWILPFNWAKPISILSQLSREDHLSWVANPTPQAMATLFEHGVMNGHRISRDALARRVQEADLLQAQLDAISERVGRPWHEHLEYQSLLLASQSAQLRESSEKIQQLQNEFDTTVRNLKNEFDTTVRNLKHELSNLQGNMASILTSRSWRLTAPLRQLVSSLRLLKNRTTYVARTIYRGFSRWPMVLQILREHGFKVLLKRIWSKLKIQTAPMRFESLTLLNTQAAISDLKLDTCTGKANTPTITIVIPVHGKHEFTFNCLKSIAEHTDLNTVEIIVVDDASPEPAQVALAQVEGVRWLLNETNLGFIGSCNHGASHALGRYILMLNNDVQVTPGWLDAMRQVLETRADVGLVGARLVYPDGTLQEAGGIVWQDGSAWNWGRNQDPESPPFRFLREADYCSGACLLMRTTDWKALGGFDPAFSPAYYEDTDLAFRVRSHGLKVIYQPEALVIHFEGVTSGTDVRQGVKRHQIDNQKIFFQRWHQVLQNHRPNGIEPHKESQRMARAHMLIIEACMITPDMDSGSVRMFELIGILSGMGVAVSFVADNLEYRQPYVRQLQQMGIEVWHSPHVQSVEHLLKEQGRRFDIVMVCRHYIASPLTKTLRKHAPQAQLWFDTVDLHYLREQRLATLEGSPQIAKVAARTRLQELQVIREFDLSLVVSPIEKKILIDEVPGKVIEVLSNIHEPISQTRGYSEREGLLFIGGFQHPPNVDAVLWFVSEVWPLIRQQQPTMQLRVVGSKTPEKIQSLAGNGVEILGYVEDVSPLLANSRISIAPLRYGAGVKGKINQAMAHGLPVVATTAAVEGMDLHDGDEVLIADSPSTFAEQILRLDGDSTLWGKLAEGGKANIREHFSRDHARNTLSRLLALNLS